MTLRLRVRPGEERWMRSWLQRIATGKAAAPSLGMVRCQPEQVGQNAPTSNGRQIDAGEWAKTIQGGGAKLTEQA
jgi:hypothetical protein